MAGRRQTRAGAAGCPDAFPSIATMGCPPPDRVRSEIGISSLFTASPRRMRQQPGGGGIVDGMAERSRSCLHKRRTLQPGTVGRYQLDTGVNLLTPAERTARGKAARAQVPRDTHAVFDPPPDRPDPVGLLEEQAQVPGARAGPGPLGADDGLPVHLLPWRGPADGQRPGHHARIRAGRAGLRRCPLVQLRPVRLGRTAPDVRRQRLRRDAARALGMGRQTAGGQPGGRGPGQRIHGQGSAAMSSWPASPATGRPCASSPP